MLRPRQEMERHFNKDRVLNAEIEIKPQRFLGLNLTFIDKKQLVQLVEKAPGMTFVCTVNAQFIIEANEKPEYKRILESYYCTIDGQIVNALHRLKGNEPVEKLAGSEFVFDFMPYFREHKQRIFIIGGMPEVNQKAVARLNAEGIEADGIAPDFMEDVTASEFSDPIIQRIREFRPHVLYVCLGAVRQETWLHHHYDELSELGCRLGLGLGGCVDFLAGDVQRCPKWIASMGLESLHRLSQQPNLGRLKRIFQSMKVFKYLFRA